MGVNGAGKTAIFSMLAGDIPATHEDVYVSGYHVSKDLREYRQNISYCPQSDALLEFLTPEETLAFYARLRGENEFMNLFLERPEIYLKDNQKSLEIFPLGMTEEDVPKNVDHIMNSTDLTKFRKTSNSNLSGGNKRKLGLAIAAIGGPSVIFLDEPTTGVDPVSERKIWATSIGLRESGRSSILLTSHSIDECEALCKRIAIMSKGQIRCLSKPFGFTFLLCTTIHFSCFIGSSTYLKNKFRQGYTLLIKFEK